MKREDLIGGAITLVSIGGFAALMTKSIMSDREKTRIQQKYIMEHPEEFKFYTDVDNAMKLEREAEHYKNAYNMLMSEVSELRETVKGYLDKDIERLTRTKTKYFGADE